MDGFDTLKKVDNVSGFGGSIDLQPFGMKQYVCKFPYSFIYLFIYVVNSNRGVLIIDYTPFPYLLLRHCQKIVTRSI